MKYPPNKRLTGEYNELRDRIQRLVDCGFKIQKLIEISGVSYSSVYDWLKKGRNLNHESAIKLEESLLTLKQMVIDAIDDKNEEIG